MSRRKYNSDNGHDIRLADFGEGIKRLKEMNSCNSLEDIEKYREKYKHNYEEYPIIRATESGDIKQLESEIQANSDDINFHDAKLALS